MPTETQSEPFAQRSSLLYWRGFLNPPYRFHSFHKIFGVLCNVDVHVWACLCVYADVNVGVLRVSACRGQRITTGTAP